MAEENESAYVREIADFILGGTSDRNFLTPER
jgi:hypothetical protein